MIHCSNMKKILPLLFVLALLTSCVTTSGSRDLNMPAPAGNARIVLWRKSNGERIDVMYRVGGAYNPEAFEKIDHIFRDSQNGDEYTIDPNLIELIAGLRDRMVMAPDTPIELLSGYRSPSTNEKLSRTNKYVAKQSYHMKGKAADIRIPDMNSHALELVAKTIQRGGVALYPDSGHVHVDTGPVRGWEVVPGYEAGLERAGRKQYQEKAEPVKAEPVTLAPVVEPLPPTVPQAKAPKGKLVITPPSSPSARTPKAKPVTAPTVRYKKAKPVISSKKPAKKNAAAQKKPAKSGNKTP
jgi:uncharacterized protein YcbK (DUF882 family)